MRRLVLAIVTATALSTLVLTLLQAHSTVPGENGRIVFRQYFNRLHHWGALFSINPDGTGERQITHPAKGVLDTEPDVSPDGHWIVYERWWRSRGQGIIFRIRMNGRHRKNLTGATCPRVPPSPELHCIFDTLPSWSPDGRHVAFSRVFDPGTKGGYDLYVMRANGTHIHAIDDPDPRFWDYASQWSPDGSRLVFFRYDHVRDKDAYLHRPHRWDAPAPAHSVAPERRVQPGLVTERTVDPVHSSPGRADAEPMDDPPERDWTASDHQHGW
jgi:hypothetical protein